VIGDVSEFFFAGPGLYPKVGVDDGWVHVNWRLATVAICSLGLSVANYGY
jgi:hypothetical protein